MEKLCISCKLTLPLSEFYKHSEMADGHLNKCKECVKAYQRKRPYSREYERSRAKLPHRVAARKEYAKTDASKESRRRARKKWEQQNSTQKQANEAVGGALRDGRLTKPERCSHCGLKKPLQGHHEDYTKPLEVIWLCVKCHNILHAVYRTVGRRIPA